MPVLDLQVRPATDADVAEVVRLAAMMFGSLGYDVTDPEWRSAAHSALAERLDVDAAAFVVDHPEREGRLVASGAGTIARRLPVPGNPSARVGYVQWVATDAEWQGRGLGRAVMARLLRWYAERDVRVVELHTSPAGERMYRAIGFAEGDHPSLQIRVSRGHTPNGSTR